MEIINAFHRTLHSCNGMMGNWNKMVGKSKVCMGMQSQLIVANFIVYSYFKFISLSLQKESDDYIQLGRISWLWIPIQTFVLITQHALTTMKG